MHKTKRTVRAITPVLAILLMIVITVAAALVTYAWVMGYISFNTAKAGKAIQIQSIANNGSDMLVYVQNVGDDTVQLDPTGASAVYINGVLKPYTVIPATLQKGETATLTVTGQAVDAGDEAAVKITTLGGAFTEATYRSTTRVEYAITVTVSGSGSIAMNPDQATYQKGDIVELTATTDLGWTFAGWSGDLTGSGNPESVTVTRSLAITAIFTQNEYTLTVNTVGSGSVVKNPDQSTYHYGDIVQLTANPAPSWIFSAWSGDLTGSTNPDSITMDNHKIVTATFLQLVDLVLLDDDFESWNTWDATSSSWYLSPDQDHSGRYSAKSSEGQEGDFICDPLNTQGAEAVTLDFWYRLANGVDGGDFIIYFYDGSHWDQIVDLGSQGEGSWRHYTYATTDTQYFKSNFRIRFDSDLSGSETIWIDDVVIVKTTSALLDDGFEGSSSTWDDDWDATGHDWYRSTTRRSGSYAAGSRNGDEGYFYSDPRDTRNSIAVIVDFWYRLDDTESSDLDLRYYDGSNWDYITELGTGSEDTWLHYTDVITDAQYFKSNFRIRFNASPDNNEENVWVDDVLIIAVRTADALLTDGFETWDDNWDASSSSWLLGADQDHSGSYAAKSTNGQEGNFYSDPRDTSSAISIEIDFWYRVDDLEDSDLRLYYYDGSNYDFISNLGTDPEDTWRHYNDVITDAQYFKSNFRIRFYTNLGSGENLWIDDVTITMTYIS